MKKLLIPSMLGLFTLCLTGCCCVDQFFACLNPCNHCHNSCYEPYGCNGCGLDGCGHGYGPVMMPAQPAPNLPAPGEAPVAPEKQSGFHPGSTIQLAAPVVRVSPSAAPCGPGYGRPCVQHHPGVSPYQPSVVPYAPTPVYTPLPDPISRQSAAHFYR